MELGKKIKQLRMNAGLTQDQLGERLGITPQSVSKWENAVALPDITLLPQIAETFGISIDDLFDLTVEQKLNRIENRMDIENDLPEASFSEYEEFLKSQFADSQYKHRATVLIAHLYWHKMNAYAEKVRRYAKEAVKEAPGEKECQWLLQKAEGHAAWDWNVTNHSRAVRFYESLVKENPDVRLSYLYLIDNLIADHRTDEAEEYLNRLASLKDSNPIKIEVYRAHIALARFDEKNADGIIESLIKEHREDSVCLFEAAQYYALKCDYDKAISYYELSFEKETRRPRFTDELQSIADIYEIKGEYKKAHDTYARITELLQKEWGMTEETELKRAQAEMSRLLSLVKE